MDDTSRRQPCSQTIKSPNGWSAGRRRGPPTSQPPVLDQLPAELRLRAREWLGLLRGFARMSHGLTTPAPPDVPAALGGDVAGWVGDQPAAHNVVLGLRRLRSLDGVKDVQQLGRRPAARQGAKGDALRGVAVAAA
jgi:hypothetical protein